MRQAAQEIATAWLGERTEQQLKLAADKGELRPTAIPPSIL